MQHSQSKTKRQGESGAGILFAFPAFANMAQGIARQHTEFRIGKFSISRFPNGERQIALATHVRGRRCIVVGSIAPPEEHMVAYLLLCHALRSAGAKHITAVLPYLAYARQDKKERGKSHGAAFVGEMLSAAGVDSVLAVDAHSAFVAQDFPMPLYSLSPSTLFVAALERYALVDASIVAPDKGAVARGRALLNAMKFRDFAYLTKQRTKTGVAHVQIHGKVSGEAVVVDDILDTGATLISCITILRSQGVSNIYLLVTHCLFTGSEWKQLWRMGVKQLITTDSVPRPPHAPSRNITTIALAPLLANTLYNMHTDGGGIR